MRHVSDAGLIKGYLKDRLVLEQQLAQALLDKFKGGMFHNDILACLQEAMGFFAALRGIEKTLLTRVEAKNQFLDGLRKNGKTAQNVYRRLKTGQKISLTHCGDLIRFFGEVVDELSKSRNATKMAEFLKREDYDGPDYEASQAWLDMRAEQIGWRYGGGGERWKALHKQGHRAEADRGSVWQKVGTESFGSGGRIRTPNPIQPNKRYANPFPGRSLPTRFLKMEHLGIKGGYTGSTVWVLNDNSTVRKVDLVFGLPEGADISGTTTDCMHFFSAVPHLGQMGSGLNPGPFVLMLPLATIVAEYHHSLLEVALAMSLKKIINYQIGFYTSLMPDPSGPGKIYAKRIPVKTVLQKFESDPRNRHLLIYYKNNSPEIDGCFIAEPREFGQFKQLATCDIRLWPRFNALSAYPSENDVMSLMASVGLRDAALQSRRGGLRQTGHNLW